MSYAIMPLQDWQNILSSVKAKTGKSNALVSSQVPGEIDSITSGGGGGGSAELNISYGDTPPEDTTKLWVKCDEPNGVIVSSNVEYIETYSGDDEAKESTKTLSTTLPNACQDMGIAAVDKQIYMFGGRNQTSSGSSVYQNQILLFDVETEKISTLSETLPTGLGGVSAAAVGKKIYLFGGGGTSNYYENAIMRFDTETKDISILSAVLPIGAQYIGSAVVGKKIYLFGGSWYDGGRKYIDKIYCFDTETESDLTEVGTLATLNTGSRAVAIGRKIYLFGGQTNASTDVIQCFDVDTHEIVNLDVVLPSKLGTTFAIGAIKNKIYIGGFSSTGEIICFDLESQTIDMLSVKYSTAASSRCGIIVDNKMYAFGGFMTSPRGSTTAIDCLTISVAKEFLLNHNTLQIIPNQTNMFPIVQSNNIKIEIGVNAVYIGNEDGYSEIVEAALYKDGAWTNI